MVAVIAGKELYLAWLKDAHAMEIGLITILEKQISEMDDAPDIQTKLKEHLEDTREHARRIEECIERGGGTVSSGKDIMSKFSASLQGLGVSMMEDAMIKNLHSSYAAEHFEIATYTILIAAAEENEDEETASTCSDILEDEIDMANWILDQLPEAVADQLSDDTG